MQQVHALSLDTIFDPEAVNSDSNAAAEVQTQSLVKALTWPSLCLQAWGAVLAYYGDLKISVVDLMYPAGSIAFSALHAAGIAQLHQRFAERSCSVYITQPVLSESSRQRGPC